MKYIYSQLLALIKEEYDNFDIIKELGPDEDVISAYIYDNEWKPENIFDIPDLEEWIENHGYILKTEDEKE